MKLFIGNLNYNTDNKTLKEHLEQFGVIQSCTVVLDKFTFRSKGFAEATTVDKQTAEMIIEGASGSILDGRPLRVEYFT